MPKQSEQLGDDALVKLVLEGRSDAFETLVKRHQRRVFSLVAGHVPAQDVEDVAQEAFLRAYKSLANYQGRGKGFGAWLAAIAVRTCHDHWRKVYRRKETPVSHISQEHENWLDSALAESSIQALEEKGASQEARELLEAALDRLEADDRMVLELVYLQELSGKEAARLLGWSTAKVKVRCFRAKRKLEDFLLRLKGREGI